MYILMEKFTILKAQLQLVVADNLAAHAFGGFSVISVLFKSFVAFAMLQNRR